MKTDTDIPDDIAKWIESSPDPIAALAAYRTLQAKNMAGIVAEFVAAGFTEAEAHEWREVFPCNLEGCVAWRDIGFSAAEAHEWRNAWPEHSDPYITPDYAFISRDEFIEAVEAFYPDAFDDEVDLDMVLDNGQTIAEFTASTVACLHD